MGLRLLSLRVPPFLAGSRARAARLFVTYTRFIVLALAGVVVVPVDGLAAEPAISGTLLIVGGGPLPDAIRSHFVELAGGKNARIVVIPTASNKADKPNQIETYLRFKAMDVKSVQLLHTRDRKKADDPDFVKPLTEATGVWLTGGDQSRLSAVYHGTAVEKELQKVVARGGVIGGTSAGAAVMSAVMIVGGIREAEVGDGFGLLTGVVIDQHFWNRQRLTRLLGVLAKHPECPGIGIDEETALVVHGQTAMVEGIGNVRACLCACGKLPASVQVLKDGEKLDLAALVRSAMTRGKGSVESTTGANSAAPAPTTTNVSKPVVSSNQTLMNVKR
jgi:cyanophycinase